MGEPRAGPPCGVTVDPDKRVADTDSGKMQLQWCRDARPPLPPRRCCRAVIDDVVFSVCAFFMNRKR
eukprot:1680982-Prymnesium_polylepis.1